MRSGALIFIVLTMFLVCSCSGSDSDMVASQRESIIKYLNSKKFEYVEQNGVFKYVVNSNRADYQTATIASSGDSIYYNFEAFDFTSAPGSLFFTNKKTVVEQWGDLNTEFWSLDTVRVKIGSTPLIPGIGGALDGCRKGDSVMLFITSNLAYGSKPMGVLPENTPVVYTLNIENIKK